MSYAVPAGDYAKDLESQGYVPLPRFAIIDECEFHDGKTKQHVKLDRARLEKMAEFHNNLIRNRKSPPVICLGHTKDDAPESDQPPVVGVATDFSVEPFGDGKTAIFVTPWAKPGKIKLDREQEPVSYVDVFKANPQRSSELWLDPDALNPIALLGATTPRRDLGVHLFSRQFGEGHSTSSGSVVRFSRGSEFRTPILFEMGADMDGNKVKCEEPGSPADMPGLNQDPMTQEDKTVADVTNSASIKSISDKLDSIMQFVQKWQPLLEDIEQEEMAAAGGQGPGGPGESPPGAGAAPGAGAPPAGAGASPDQGGGQPPAPEEEDEEPPPPDRGGEGPAKKNFAGSPAGYGATMMPNYADPRRPEQFARGSYDHQSAIRFQKLEADNAALQAKLSEAMRLLAANQQETAAIKLSKIESEVDTALASLAAEGYAVVPEQDKPDLCKLSPDARAKRLQFMRQTRAKSQVVPEVPGGKGNLVNPADVAQPVKFERPEIPGLGADPALKSVKELPDDYTELARIASSVPKGQRLADVFDVTRLAPAANGVAVR